MDDFIVRLRRVLGLISVEIHDNGNSVLIEAKSYIPYDKLRWVNHIVEKFGGKMISNTFMHEKWEVPKPKN